MPSFSGCQCISEADLPNTNSCSAAFIVMTVKNHHKLWRMFCIYRYNMINKIYLIPLVASLLLAGCTEQGPSPQKADMAPVSSSEANGLIVQRSAHSFAQTYTNLKTALADNPALTIVAEVDHAENAAKAGLDLRPTKLIIFGNPNLGTPLMQESPTTAIDLPQKFLIYQEDDAVFVVYNDPMYLANRHGIQNHDAELGKIAGALKKLSETAINK